MDTITIKLCAKKYLAVTTEATHSRLRKNAGTHATKDSGSRCLMKPDKGKLENFIGKRRWYYDINKNACEKTRQTSVWKGTGNTNLFATEEECEKLCKPVH
uniref:Putative salivary kunitz domain protein n=1 Tax=Ixodes ricinus TaxID=34613 RepID=A0A0K8RE01_IXORI